MIAVHALDGLATSEPKQANPELEQGIRLERTAGASGRNGLAPPAEHRFRPGRSGNPNGRPRKAVTAKQLRKMAWQLTPGAVQRLVELVGSHDEKVPLGASLAILERDYGQPVCELDIERHLQWEAEEAERQKKKAARHAALEAARANLLGFHGAAHRRVGQLPPGVGDELDHGSLAVCRAASRAFPFSASSASSRK